MSEFHFAAVQSELPLVVGMTTGATLFAQDVMYRQIRAPDPGQHLLAHSDYVTRFAKFRIKLEIVFCIAPRFERCADEVKVWLCVRSNTFEHGLICFPRTSSTDGYCWLSQRQ